MTNENAFVFVRTMQEAVSALEHRVNKYNDEGFVEAWSLTTIVDVLRSDNNNNNNNNHHHDDERNNNYLWWDRFLTMLLKESSKTRLASIKFSKAVLDRPNDEVLERLFRDVLPNLSSLTEIEFFTVQILPAYMDMFVMSLINNNDNNNVNLRALAFSKTQLHSSSVAAIAQLLSCGAKNGTGPRIDRLYLYGCSIDSTGGETIFKALDGNNCLKELNLQKNTIAEISLDAARALRNCKSLWLLSINENPLSEPSLCHLAEGLQTNHSLRTLDLRSITKSRRSLDAFSYLLKTFHYRLEAVYGLDELQEKNELLRHNQRIRRLILSDRLLEIITIDTAPDLQRKRFLLPLALRCICSKPSLIYGCVRHDNLEMFTNQLLLSTGSNKNKNNNISKSVGMKRAAVNKPHTIGSVFKKNFSSSTEEAVSKRPQLGSSKKNDIEENPAV